jgi:hypothetical protein
MRWTEIIQVMTQIEPEGFLDSCLVVHSDSVAGPETIGKNSPH